jgi:hypothetical protein
MLTRSAGFSAWLDLGHSILPPFDSKHARYYWLVLAESHLTRYLFGGSTQVCEAPITSRIG